mmetsp:Transcript_49086/g.92017  ORF Transcript_49086/g.92017 Transcript_49086/m.92017 type:complete len:94 (+) Transcript_49086:1314-1595(+)
MLDKDSVEHVRLMPKPPGGKPPDCVRFGKPPDSVRLTAKRRGDTDREDMSGASVKLERSRLKLRRRGEAARCIGDCPRDFGLGGRRGEAPISC